MQPWQEKGQIRIFKCFNELSINMNIFAFPFFRKNLTRKNSPRFFTLDLASSLGIFTTPFLGFVTFRTV